MMPDLNWLGANLIATSGGGLAMEKAIGNGERQKPEEVRPWERQPPEEDRPWERQIPGEVRPWERQHPARLPWSKVMAKSTH